MNSEILWSNIKRYQGDVFHTVRGKPYKYVVHNDSYLTVENVKGSKIKKEYIERAMQIRDPSPKKISLIGCWGPSYIYGLITDKRIITP